ncbi:hypothetical protein PROFUN_04111 [Planoprotostelium fungivorum]|uniref:ADF-H domain-containing protein n=1 Tax=Planoprotostelium fungivorum TaxID=1890364 RepID=A0A2P6NJJ4_9EUKA|nr:hypothetical protein PROFUN_04111 [Planoprotostelium fungivorum]
MALKFSPEIKKAQQKIYGQLSGWIVLGYAGGDNIEVQATSDNSNVEELVSHLKDDQVQYALIRLVDTSKDVNKVDRQDGKTATKDIFIAWSGPSVRQIEKGKKASHAGSVATHLQPFHAELTAINRANFTESVVRDKASPLSGSHVID